MASHRIVSWWLLWFCLIGMPTLADAGWLEDAMGLRPGPFPLPPPVEVHYEFGWEEFPAADAIVQLRPGSRTIVGEGSGRTTGPVRPIWPFACEVLSRVRRADYISTEFRNREEFRSKIREATVRYRPDEVRIERVETEKGNEPVAADKRFALSARDLLATSLLFRSQTLEDGAVYSAVVVPGWSPYLVTVEVIGREIVKLGKEEIEERDSIRLRVEIEKIERDGSLTKFEKFKKATLWLSDDALRLPLRIEAEIFVGKVYGVQTLVKPL